MSKKEKLIKKLMDKQQTGNLRFSEFKTVLVSLGFSVRNTGGSHHVCSNPGVREIINIQPKENGKSKPYQVDQAREIIKQYKLI